MRVKNMWGGGGLGGCRRSGGMDVLVSREGRKGWDDFIAEIRYYYVLMSTTRIARDG